MDHLLKLMEYIQEFDNGGIIDDGTQVNAILHTLSAEYNQFLHNYAMNDKTLTLTQLLQQLRAVGDQVKQVKAHTGGYRFFCSSLGRVAKEEGYER